VVRSYRGKGKTKDHTEEVVSLSGKRVADRGGGLFVGDEVEEIIMLRIFSKVVVVFRRNRRKRGESEELHGEANIGKSLSGRNAYAALMYAFLEQR